MERGICPVCGRDIALRGGGPRSLFGPFVRDHKAKGGPAWVGGDCQGSGRAPVKT